jgi:hypothetical protein
MRAKLFIALCLLLFTLQTASCETANTAATLIFDDTQGKYYNYCPSYIQTSDDTRVIFYCRNKDHGVIVDSIYTRKATLADGCWTWGEQAVALRHGNDGWDSIHVCDPDVKKGQFMVDGHEYAWVMFYLGTDQLNNCHNQIGIAFSDSIDGPWVKWSQNPLITSIDKSVWGVGQPSAVSLNGKGEFLLFYSGVDSATTLAYRHIDLSDMSVPEISPPKPVFCHGLTEKDGGNTNFFHNVGVAIDMQSGNLYTIRERGPAPVGDPDFVSDELQVAYASLQAILDGNGLWTVEGEITPDVSGHPRNHNATILTDLYGVLAGGAQGYTLAFCASGTGYNNLWTYRVFEAHYNDLSADE